MISLIYQIGDSDLKRTIEEIGYGPEQSNLARMIYDPQNIGEVRYVNNVLRQMTNHTEIQIEQAREARQPSIFFELLRSGYIQKIFTNGFQSEPILLRPIMDAYPDTIEETTISIEIGSFEYYMLYWPDTVYYFDANGNRIYEEDPDEYSYTYEWLGSGNRYSNDDYLDINRYTLRYSWVNDNDGNMAVWELTLRTDDIELEFTTKLTFPGQPIATNTPGITMVHGQDIIGFEDSTSIHNLVNNIVSSRFVSR